MGYINALTYYLLCIHLQGLHIDVRYGVVSVDGSWFIRWLMTTVYFPIFLNYDDLRFLCNLYLFPVVVLKALKLNVSPQHYGCVLTASVWLSLDPGETVVVEL